VIPLLSTFIKKSFWGREGRFDTHNFKANKNQPTSCISLIAVAVEVKPSKSQEHWRFHQGKRRRQIVVNTGKTRISTAQTTVLLGVTRRIKSHGNWSFSRPDLPLPRQCSPCDCKVPNASAVFEFQRMFSPTKLGNCYP